MRKQTTFLAVTILVLLVFNTTSGIIAGSVLNHGKDTETPATGLKDPTAPQEDWMKRNFPLIERIQLNHLALERINAERVARGQSKISDTEAGIVPLGSELQFIEFKVDWQASLKFDTYSILPTSVDNSLLPAFPPIRSQGGIGSCVAWATTYYQLTYETNLVRGRIASNGDNNVIFSPKWTYNMINNGVDGGAYFSDAYSLLIKHGAVTWAEFPYDKDYLSWCLNATSWRNAINYRPFSWGQIYSSNTTQMVLDLKTQLANGHVLVIGTYVYSWVQTYVSDDPSTFEDDAYVGQKIASYMKNTRLGGHAMTIVGYNDNIWCDLNGNMVVDPGEKGAFKIANSWGTSDWNGGFRWVAYDALFPSSSVKATETWPPSDRDTGGIFRGGVYTMTARESYTPQMIAEFTLNHLKRRQLLVSLGVGNDTQTTPALKWYSKALYYSGGDFSFDGTTAACDATFVFDFTDLASAGYTRWFLGVYDNIAGDPAIVKSYSIYRVDETGDHLVGKYTNLPVSIDAGQLNIWIDYSRVENIAPNAIAIAVPKSGYAPLTVNFDGSASYDPDGSIVSYDWDFGDGCFGTGAKATHTYTSKGTYLAKLTVTDDKGAKGSVSVTVEVLQESTVVNAPTELVASGNSYNVRLVWKDNSNNEDGFYIERGTKVKNAYVYQRIATVGANTTSYVDTTAGQGTYQYRVQAFNKSLGVVSEYSNSVTIRVK
ncbi:MAG: PKD domain-containing protein [Candidatus Verstraetearchaeota archaeon]|nr:PKD domain-containing protein [Candidatus Verstraetearchaeota archaeon]